LILLDENTLLDQFQILEARRLRVRKGGKNWGRGSMSDGEILAALRPMRQVTFFTSDADFYRRGYCHPGYCLALVSAPPREFAGYAMRLLRHPAFRTHSLRMGKVIRVQPTGIVYWQHKAIRETALGWR
jgi:hypothetical protein